MWCRRSRPVTCGWSRSAGLPLRDVLLVIQIVVCTLLVTASAVAIRSMQRAMHVPLGFDPQGVMVAQSDLNMGGYSK